jgi:hypothetical protein
METRPSRAQRRQRIRRQDGLPARRSRPPRSPRQLGTGPGSGTTPGTLHHLAALLTLASVPMGTAKADPPARQQRRRRQHRALAQRLLDPLPPSLRSGGRDADVFWRALRYGGAGLLLAWWLMR